MIYKNLDLKHIAAEHIFEDMKKNPYLVFTNTSYGEPGDNICGIEGDDPINKIHWEIIYYLTSGSWTSNKCGLFRVTKTTFYEIKENGIVIRNYHTEKQIDTILELWQLTQNYKCDVATTDRVEGEKAREVYLARCKEKGISTYKNYELNLMGNSYKKFADLIYAKWRHRLASKDTIKLQRINKQVLLSYTYRNTPYTRCYSTLKGVN